MSGSLGSDQRWPQFGSKVARLGVHSAVSLPLITAHGVVGAMNVYAHGKHVFDDRAAALGEAFAGPAAVAVQNAAILAQALRLARHLEASQATRSIVDRAVGMLMSRTGIDEHDALERLRALSQQEHRKLVDVAGSSSTTPCDVPGTDGGHLSCAHLHRPTGRGRSAPEIQKLAAGENGPRPPPPRSEIFWPRPRT